MSMHRRPAILRRLQKRFACGLPFRALLQRHDVHRRVFQRDEGLPFGGWIGSPKRRVSANLISRAAAMRFRKNDGTSSLQIGVSRGR
jgi:hypothetical protein